jgi:hypothetical protein
MHHKTALSEAALKLEKIPWQTRPIKNGHENNVVGQADSDVTNNLSDLSLICNFDAGPSQTDVP